MSDLLIIWGRFRKFNQTKFGESYKNYVLDTTLIFIKQ